MSTVSRVVISILCFIVTGLLPGCYFDWDQVEYVEPCDPLRPELKCSPHERCVPQKEGDPVCEGPAEAEDNRNGYCESNDECSKLEVCTLLDERLAGKICTQLCHESSDCPDDDDYSCMFLSEMSVRGEKWGVCVVDPPREWHCEDNWYAAAAGGLDEQCNCGCGAFDPDCPDAEYSSCDTCETEIQEECLPEGWNCPTDTYYDDDCDCGCGLIDTACKNNTRESCEGCPAGSCASGECSTTFDPIDLNDNSKCKELPDEWSCHPEEYQDGIYCHCGCGVRDVDCEGDESSYCDSACSELSCGYEANCDTSIFKESDASQCK